MPMGIFTVKIHILWHSGNKLKANTSLSYGNISIYNLQWDFSCSNKSTAENTVQFKLKNGDTKHY